MPLTDQTRITRERMTPRITALWQALAQLQSVVSFMNTGAHPDDETSAMLAALGLRDGIDLSYACSTRGEGGQNDIGTETTEALGVLRTAEMERACDVLGLRMYWLSETPDDTIFDFGFSKSGVETMGKWGRDRTLKRFVDILRMERPDIICPTFLDIPGQHGHHRAMTEAAHLVMDLAGDPAFTDSALDPWQVKKLYLPAWSGAGQAYDDDLPPPPATLTISADGVDPVTGFSYERIGQQSRAYHLTQAMGRWVPAGAERNWPLHLADSRVAGPDTALSSGLAATLRDFNSPDLSHCQDHIDAARLAFPDFKAVLREACLALTALDAAEVAPEIAHKIARKRTQLATVIRIAAGVQVQARTAKDLLRQTDQTIWEVEQRIGDADQVDVTADMPAGWDASGGQITLNDAALTDPYPPIYLPDTPQAPCLAVTVTAHGTTSTTHLPFEVPPLVIPARAAALLPLAEVVNLQSNRREVALSVSGISPTNATPEISLPTGWQATPTETGFAVTLPQDTPIGRYTLPLTLDGEAAQTLRLIDHPHIAPRALAQPAEAQVQVVDVALPDTRIGYIGGGNDRVDHWLRQIGLDVTTLSDEALQSDATLAQFDTLLIGIFAIRFRKGLSERMAHLHKWCDAGGTLVTLYHRPWDNWDQHSTPPRPLEIGQPSLRWRVTDQNAAVTTLEDHPILSHPNQITATDWEGWHKERGLYFAKSWDAAYTPLLQMADPDEAPQKGALLVADIGKGRHIHCALILHHQMEKLTPGAFRLMANLLAKRS